MVSAGKRIVSGAEFGGNLLLLGKRWQGVVSGGVYKGDEQDSAVIRREARAGRKAVACGDKSSG